MYVPLVDTIKNIAAAVGVVLPLGAVYTAAGLPVPATISQVEQRIEPVRYGLTNLEVVVLQQQRESIRARRNFLRQDKFTLLTQKKEGLKDGLAQLNESRLAEIEDSLKEVEGKDIQLERRIQELTAKPWQDQVPQRDPQKK